MTAGKRLDDGPQGVLSFTFIAAFVLLSGALSVFHASRVYRNDRAVVESFERRAAVARVLSLMQDAETGQRGYLITGDERYLEPYHRAVRVLNEALDEAERLDWLTPEEARLFETVQGQIVARKAELESTIAIRRDQGFDAAREAVLTGLGLQVMDGIRQKVASIDELEANVLKERAEESRVSYLYALASPLLSSLLGLGLVFTGYRVINRSAQQRAQDAAARHEQAERFRVTLASIGDAVIVTDAEAKVRFMNPVAENLTGWTSGWDGQGIRDVFRIRDEGSKQPGRDPIEGALHEGVVVGLANHTELVSRTGEVVPIDDSAAPIFDSNRKIVGAVLVFRDIAERRQAEQLVQRQKAALEENDRRKDEFLAMLAHELRNPLAVLRNATEVLRLSRGDSGDGEKARGMIERQIRQMARMVDDLIDVARISTGRMALRRSPIGLREVIDASLETTAPLLRDKSHRLDVHVPDGPLFVDGDAVRLSQVVTNLLNNAIKYTPPGGHIELSVSTDAHDVVISVKDNGQGIDAQLLPHVFDLFRQGQPSTGSNDGGLGIGLTLVRRIVDLHSGQMHAASDGPSKGSIFKVTLPLCAPPEAQRPSATATPGYAHRVLIIEDNADSREALETVVRLSGFEVASAPDGPAGLSEARARKPTVALVDLGLPGMTGHEVAQVFRSDANLKGIALVALTGWARDEDRERSVAAGFDHHLVKPVEPDALLKLLATLKPTL